MVSPVCMGKRLRGLENGVGWVVVTGGTARPGRNQAGAARWRVMCARTVPCCRAKWRCSPYPHCPVSPLHPRRREVMLADKDGGISPSLPGPWGSGPAERREAEAPRGGGEQGGAAGPARPAAGLRPAAAALPCWPGQTAR